MAANGPGSLVFIDDVTADKSNSRMNCKVLTFSQPNASQFIRWWLTVQMDSDPKQTLKATQDFYKTKKIQCFAMAMSIT